MESLPLFEPAASYEDRPVIAGRNGVTYRALQAKSILNFAKGSRMSDVWTINPYRGCEFACAYCYARYTHEYLDHEDPIEFERQVYVKQEAARILDRELRKQNVRDFSIAIGTATDPYQPAEARHQVTRSLLEVFRRYTGLSIGITTKGALIRRDVELLAELSAQHRLTVHLSIASLDAEFLRVVEGRTAHPGHRLKAMKILADAGVRVGLFMLPVLPYLTDSEARMRPLLAAARDHGARFAIGGPLFLMSASRVVYFNWLRETHRDLLPKYFALYANSGEAREEYRAALKYRIRQLVEELGLEYGMDEDLITAGRRMPGVVKSACG
ncbi:MAG: hypothetical protein GMKNLPBB_02796 [Myxococcota bacterium]|nr:hypothetical protein [Myxococcota bacterium]